MLIDNGDTRRGLGEMLLSAHRETDWSRMRGDLCEIFKF